MWPVHNQSFKEHPVDEKSDIASKKTFLEQYVENNLPVPEFGTVNDNRSVTIRWQLSKDAAEWTISTNYLHNFKE